MKVGVCSSHSFESAEASTQSGRPVGQIKQCTCDGASQLLSRRRCPAASQLECASSQVDYLIIPCWHTDALAGRRWTA